MPALSFILSGLLVGAGSIYMYLSQTDKIEKTKQKIAESNKVTYLSKKSSLTLSSVKNIDTNNSIDVMATTGDKLSNFVSKDENTDSKQIILLDKCQKEVEKIILSGNTPNESTIPACKQLKDKKFEFYGLSSSGVDIPEKSILKKDKLLQTKLQDEITFASVNQKIKQFKKKKFIDKKIASISTPNMKKHLKNKLFAQEISRYKNIIKRDKKYLDYFLSYKQSLISNISDIENEISSLEKQSNSNKDKNEKWMMTKMTKMFDISSLINTKKSKLQSKQKDLHLAEFEIKILNSRIKEYQNKIKNLEGKKDD